MAQAQPFPETTFELLLFIALVLGLITGALAFIWRKKS
jgi:hypothetical protein